MYCVGAPATHYFPVSIPYHGCALNITVQSYLDQLDFGLVACSETVPDAQRIADFIVEDFAAMRKADAELNRFGAIETIAVTPAAPLAAHKPITLGEAKLEPRAQKVEKTSALTRQLDALGESTETLLRRLGKAQPAAPANARAAKPKATTKRKRAAPKPIVCHPSDRAPWRSSRKPKRTCAASLRRRSTPPQSKFSPPPRARHERRSSSK